MATPTEELALEFANTVHWHASDKPLETLHNYGDLLRWGVEKGMLTERESVDLAEQAEAQPGAAAAVFARAVDLREAIYEVFAARVHSEEADTADLGLLNRELGLALAHAILRPVGAGYAWGWDRNADQLASPLWPLVRSAADLLANEELLGYVGQCADDRGCGWLFLDLSKNHSRRWCSINDCGNRAKQLRHRRKAVGAA